MNGQMKLIDVKGMTFIGGQITSRIEVNQKKNDVVIGTIKVIPPKAIKDGMIDYGELYEREYKAEFDEDTLNIYENALSQLQVSKKQDVMEGML